VSTSGSDEFDAYLKGYEDAMRAAGGNPLPPSQTAPAASGEPRGTAGRAVGYAIGWLIGFPLL
jgi:hypothetical protein